MIARTRYTFIQILVCFAMFFLLAGDAIKRFFGGDDLENLTIYVEHPISHWLMGLVSFWSSAWYRPLGGIVYLALFDTFGLHPLPFKIVLFAFLSLNMILCLQVVRRLSHSMQIACWVLLLCSYHAAMNGLYLNFGTIYEALGYAFFFLALLAYIRFCAPSQAATATESQLPSRSESQIPLPTESQLPLPSRDREGAPAHFPYFHPSPLIATLLIVFLYILGLTAKEMVVTLPAVLFAYSAILTRSLQSERLRWPLRSGLPIISCSIIAVVYTLGKMSGPGALATNYPAYAPHFTWEHYSMVTAYYIRQMLYLPDGMLSPGVGVFIVILMILLALALRSRLMFFSVVCVVATQLPVSFIGLRGAFVLYIPLVFWALYAVALLDAATPLLKRPLPSLVGFLALAAILFSIHFKKKEVYDEHYVTQNVAYQELARQLDSWNVHLPQPGRVLLLNDPFPVNWIAWDPAFLISLHEARTETIVNRLKFATVTPPPSEADWYDYVIDYDTAWRLLKAPRRPLTNPARLTELADNASILLGDGLDPPSRELWRMVHRTFDLKIKVPAPGTYGLTLDLFAYGPVRLSAQLDDSPSSPETTYGPGEFHLVVPIPRSARGERHTVRISKGPGPVQRLLFVTAELQPSTP